MTQTRQIWHFGPSTDVVGGMSAVITTMVDRQIGGVVHVQPTWVPSRGQTALLSARALARIARLPRGALTHFHLSHGGSWIRKRPMVAAASARGMTTVGTIHGSGFDAYALQHAGTVTKVLAGLDAVICLTSETHATVQRLAPGIATFMVPNPMQLDGAARPATATPEIAVLAGEVGTRKGVDVLAAAWPSVVAARPDARCIVVGPAANYSPPELPRFDVRPAVSPQGVRELVRDARVAVLPSRAEAMPMFLLEAAGAGRPFVSTPVGDIASLAARPDLQIVPVGDAPRLATALIRFLADADLAAEVGELGRDMLEASRGPSAYDERIRDVYERATASRVARI